MLYIRGKQGRKVPILLTPDTINAVNCLIATRETVGVNKGNLYVFAAPSRNSLSYLRGCDCLSSVVSQCELKNPGVIRSTKLRKYAATVSQVLDLDSNELEWLASHMGHDVNVHKHFNRLQDQTLELAKVSKLLLAIDEGKAGNLMGKKLDEITLEGR